jgi:hypothetical protein
MRLATLLTALALSFLPGARAEPPAPPSLTTEQVVERMMAADAERRPRLRAYTSLRRYSLRNQRFKVSAGMQARMSFRFPNTKEFQVLSQSGPGPVRKQVFNRMIESEIEAAREANGATTQIGPVNYTFRLLGTEPLDGRASYVLEAEPKTPHKMLFRGKIWVDAEDFAVARIEGSPARNPSFWVRRTSFVHRYGKCGDFWLPVSNVSVTEARLFGKTDVEVHYGEYEITAEPAAP